MQPPPLFASGPPTLPVTAASKSSTVKAGWICIALGFLTCWTLIGLVFFSVAMILGVVAMCSNKVGPGIAILGSALCSLALCVFVMMGLAFGAIVHGVATTLENGTAPKKPTYTGQTSLR